MLTSRWLLLLISITLSTGLYGAEEHKLDARPASAEPTTIDAATESSFEQVRFRPLPSKVSSLTVFHKSLEGIWKIQSTGKEELAKLPLDDSRWKDFQVPGQWLQQGIRVRGKQSISMAKEFRIPKDWAGHRIFIRFNSIHAGTKYKLNGRSLGYSERLFTPVEWEITSYAIPGELNRLDLWMKTDTFSEKLAASSRYAQHNLGGVDRSVSVYALPRIHARNLRIETDLDQNYEDAELKVNLTLDNPSEGNAETLTIDLTLLDPLGKLVEHSLIKPIAISPLQTGETPVAFSTHVIKPLKWNAEKPHLYQLAIQLKQNGKLLERIEKNIGFREIEIRGSQILVNGVVVKLAGVCRHEVNPLAGRADTAQYAEADVRQFKAANFNYIRTSHYPPTIELVEATDKYGMYLEVEAPMSFAKENFVQLDPDVLNKVLDPTSAMVDYYYSNPSVIIWSVANEAAFTSFFDVSSKLLKKWDPTRLTTFNFPDKQVCDIANLHYPPTPYDKQTPKDPRPIILGEFYFPVCHEQTDVRINPGLREFFGFGHSEPDSEWAKECAKSYEEPIPYLKPGLPPGTWSDVIHSKRVAGGAIFAAIDDSFFFRDGTHAGYSWKHGFWGMVDAWRRPKPEYWIVKMVFSPVWFASRHVAYEPGQESVSLSVENRYSFTDFSELNWCWEIGDKKGPLKVQLAPGQTGTIDVTIPAGTPVGTTLVVRVTDAKGELITAPFLMLGKKNIAPLPQLAAVVPKLRDDGQIVLIEGKGFTLVFDKSTGSFTASDARHTSPVTEFPSLHVTRFDFGDLSGGKQNEPYVVFPDAKSRVLDEATVQVKEGGVEIKVREHFDLFAGETTWLVDRYGIGRVHFDYTYSGSGMSTRETGVRFALKAECDELDWNRWSEWGDFPEDSICRCSGRAPALRTGKREADPENVKPTWPWSQDQTELGTADFRSIKFNIYNAAVMSNTGAGIRVHANADAHVRCNLIDDGVLLHALSRCRLGQIVINKGDRLTGNFVVELVRGRNSIR